MKAKPQIFVLCERRALYNAGTIQLMIMELNKAVMWHARWTPRIPGKVSPSLSWMLDE